MKNPVLSVRSCPTCGSKGIRRVRKRIVRTHQGRAYVVPPVTFYECPDCRERLYDRFAMRQIEARSPAYGKSKAAV